jgi:Holliday junction resolvasome RuvABC DNA-binding subunit
MLEHLGFKAPEARALIEKALQVVAPSDSEVLLRAALRAT